MGLRETADSMYGVSVVQLIAAGALYLAARVAS
ncbi:hypothetical protein EDE08_103502 [Bradyrhizobium sp. R2.2-H]|nr:hypothetical protein EDE10_103501 [Bradyrhizobium sp. Y-H1]TCU78050.1 hypothetical protein EDE08_103502 [Bradyrhizobium sp. R2.2-H]